MKSLAATFLLVFFLLELEAAEIIFRDQAKISGEWICLEEVAQIRPKNKKEEDRLKELYLGVFSRDSQQKILKPQYLRRRLQQFGFSGKNHRIRIPEKGIQVWRTANLNRLKEVELEVRTLLEDFYTNFSKVEVEISDPEGKLSSLSKGLLSIEIVDREFLPKYSDQMMLMLEIRSGEQTLRERFFTSINLFQNEIQSNRRLGTRLPIESHEIEFSLFKIEKDRQQGYTDLKEVVGRKLTRLIPANRRLIQGDVLPPIVIEKGELVELVKKNTVLSFRLYGRALEEGRKGDVILFEMSNGSRVKGEVLESEKALFINRLDEIKSKNITFGRTKS